MTRTMRRNTNNTWLCTLISQQVDKHLLTIVCFCFKEKDDDRCKPKRIWLHPTKTDAERHMKEIQVCNHSKKFEYDQKRIDSHAVGKKNRQQYLYMEPVASHNNVPSPIDKHRFPRTKRTRTKSTNDKDQSQVFFDCVDRLNRPVPLALRFHRQWRRRCQHMSMRSMTTG